MKYYIPALRLYTSAILLSFIPCSVADSFQPFVEPLYAEQSRSYEQASARGEDSPLEQPSLPVTISLKKSSSLSPSAMEVAVSSKVSGVTAQDKPQNQSISTELKHFGYDLFNQVPSTFAPVKDIPVPIDYRIGPGDSLVVQLYGKKNVEYKLVVTREGELLVPEYGPVSVSGLTFDAVSDLITHRFESRLIGTRATVTMGDLRTIKIRLTGDVVQPGVYTIGSLSTLIDALIVTGGIKTTGSLRDIYLIRGGKRHTSIDLYDLLLNGNTAGDVSLQYNDTIFVPPMGDVIYVAGQVTRPAIYEVKGKQTLSDAISMAGGLLPNASLLESHIERVATNNTKTIIDLSAINSRKLNSDIGQLPILNGDLIRVLALQDRFEEVVFLEGHVRRPGGYQFHQGMKITDLISGAPQLLHGGDMHFALLRRENIETLKTEAIYINPQSVFENRGTTQNILLENRDRLTFFNTAQARSVAVEDIVIEMREQSDPEYPPMIVEIHGSAKFTGTFPLQMPSRLIDIVGFAGGPSRASQKDYVLIARTDSDTGRISMHSFDLTAAELYPESAKNPQILPQDEIYFFDNNTDRNALLAQTIDTLREQTGYGEDERTVGVLGELAYPGTYPLEGGMRASDLICAAGGLTRKAAGIRASLSRIRRNSEFNGQVEHRSLDAVTLELLCTVKRSLNRGETVKPELYSFYLETVDSGIDPRLEPMDQLTLSVSEGWFEKAVIEITGEVKNPGQYVIDRGETLCQMMQRVGGLTTDAYSPGAVFTRKSIYELQEKTIAELKNQLDNLMIELSLSHSARNNEKFSPGEDSKQDYLKAIRQLNNVRPSGRLVIDLQKQTRCKASFDLVLRDGDKLNVPTRPDFVAVSGQVYVPTAQQYASERTVADYVRLSGGHTVLGRLGDAYVIQPNGEVLNYKSSRVARSIEKRRVMPGAHIMVPLNVDRMNTTEKLQSWTSSLTQAAILAGLVF